MLLPRSFMSIFQVNIDALQRETSMQSIIFNAKTSTEDILPYNFVPLKVNMTMLKMEAHVYEDECKNIYQNISEFYSSFGDNLNAWVKQFKEFSPFTYMNVNVSITWNYFKLTVQ